jgi:uncharacterized membrane protein
VLTFNILLNEALLLLFNKGQSVIVVIYFFVTGVSAIMNFFGLKNYVFSKQNDEKFI